LNNAAQLLFLPFNYVLLYVAGVEGAVAALIVGGDRDGLGALVGHAWTRNVSGLASLDIAFRSWIAPRRLGRNSKKNRREIGQITSLFAVLGLKIALLETKNGVNRGQKLWLRNRKGQAKCPPFL
jgi:hypothetical protein